MGWYKEEFLRDYFKFTLFFLLELIFLGDMILKMKKFFIQWRKFESKKSCIKKDMNFLIL